MRVVGLDPSLTSSGMAFVEPGVQIATKTVKSAGKADDDLLQRSLRIGRLCDKIIADILDFKPDLVLIEEPAHNQKSGHHHDRSGLWWLIVNILLSDGFTVREISTTSLKKYATGSGNAGKDAIVIAVTRRYPTVEFKTNDEADALVLASIGARMMGEPIEPSLPKNHLEALKALKWEVSVA